MLFDNIHYSVIERKEFYYLQYTHEDWTIYILRSGSFRCSFHGHEDVIRTGDVYIIPPNTPFSRSTITPFCVDFIRFSPHVPQELPFPLPFGKHTPKDPARLLGTLRLMRAIQRDNQLSPSDALSHLLFDLLLQLFLEGKTAPSRNGYRDEVVQEVLQFFEENYSKHFTLREVAAKHGLSPSGLIFKFKKSTGLQPMRHLIGIRIRQAKSLLSGTSRSVGEIATAVGFENCYYFSNAFKQETGHSPSEYRKLNSI